MRGRRHDVLSPAPTAMLVRLLRILPKTTAGRIMLRFTPPDN